MAVKSDDSGFTQAAFAPGTRGWHSAEATTSPTADLTHLLRDISCDTVALNEKLIQAATLLGEQGAWNAVVRLLVGVGGYQQAEIAEALQVMRSTVGRWYNGETTPSREQIPAYLERLTGYMRETRPFELNIDLEKLVDTGEVVKPLRGVR